MTDQTQLLREALEAFDAFGEADDVPSLLALTQKMEAIRTALAQPAEGGEVVTVTSKLGDLCSFRSASVRKGDKLYTTPPASQEQTDLRLVTFVREVALGAYMSVEAMLRAKELLHQIDGACQSRSAKSDQQAGLMLTDATQASQEQSDAATTAGMQSAMGNLSRLVDEATVLLSQLRTMVDDMHEQWSIGGVPERGEFPLLDRVDDWLSARPSQEQAQQPSVTVRYDLSPAMVEGAIRDRLIAMGWTPPLQQPKPQPMTDEVFDLICKAIDKADTITMEGDYMLDSDDCIAVVRVMQVLLSIRHGITSDKEA